MFKIIKHLWKLRKMKGGSWNSSSERGKEGCLLFLGNFASQYSMLTMCN